MMAPLHSDKGVLHVLAIYLILAGNNLISSMINDGGPLKSLSTSSAHSIAQLAGLPCDSSTYVGVRI